MQLWDIRPVNIGLIWGSLLNYKVLELTCSPNDELAELQVLKVVTFTGQEQILFILWRPAL